MGGHKPLPTDTISGGVKIMSIQGRLARERERLLGMTDEERAWRKQWVKDQILSKNEPRHVPELYKELNNPIRRFYRRPLDNFFKKTEPTLGFINPQVRYITGKMLIIFYLGIGGLYWLKYNSGDWTRFGGWTVWTSRVTAYPGDKWYPNLSTKTPQDYGSRTLPENPF